MSPSPAPQLPSVHLLGHATGHFLAMGPVLIAVVLLGKSIESRAKLKAMEALTDIPSSLPATAIICEASGESVQPVELVELGDVLRVYAGGRIPVDGTMCLDLKSRPSQIGTGADGAAGFFPRRQMRTPSALPAL